MRSISGLPISGIYSVFFIKTEDRGGDTEHSRSGVGGG